MFLLRDIFILIGFVDMGSFLLYIVVVFFELYGVEVLLLKLMDLEVILGFLEVDVGGIGVF